MMEAGPPEPASNHSRRPRSRAMVVSAGVKRGENPSRYESERRMQMNPRRRVVKSKCRQNRERVQTPGQICRKPDYWADGGRCIGGVTLIQASVRNCGNQSLRCQGRSTSGINREARVPMRSTGTDRPVRAWKAGNAAGAKGSVQTAVFDVQLVRG